MSPQKLHDAASLVLVDGQGRVLVGTRAIRIPFLGGFMAFCTTQGLLRSKGIGKDSTEIEVHAEARSKGSNKYTNFSFHPVK